MQNLCSLREIFRMLRDFEIKFQEDHDLCLNEGMLLCNLQSGKYTSSEIAELLGLTNSNASKVIRSVERKGYIRRSLGKNDKRQMYFSITESGRKKMDEIKYEDTSVEAVIENIKTNLNH